MLQTGSRNWFNLVRLGRVGGGGVFTTKYTNYTKINPICTFRVLRVFRGN